MFYTLIILHSLSGGVLLVNPKLITSMKAHQPNKENAHIAKDVECVINMADGKFLSVIETCDEVRKLIEELKHDRG